MGVFKNLARYALGRNLSKKNPNLTGIGYMMLGSMHDEQKKLEKEQRRIANQTKTETSNTATGVFLLIFVIAVIIAGIGSLFSNDKTEEVSPSKQTENEKVYKTNSQEYFKLLDSSASKIANNYDEIYLLGTKTSGTTYFHITLYSHKYIDEKDYEKIKDSYMKDLKEELSKYKYKSTFTNNYEIVQVYFYNIQNHYPYNRERFTWVQFYTTDLD